MSWLIIHSLLLAITGAPAEGAQVLRQISWLDLKQSGQLVSGEALSGEQGAVAEQLKLENPKEGLMAMTILVIKSPPVTYPAYGIVGEVRCEGVEGTGYLELRSDFNDGPRYSRTLDRDFRSSLTGTCDWRHFMLPVVLDEDAAPPAQLTLSLVLPTHGTVYLGPVQLVQYQEDASWLAAQSAGRTSRRFWIILISTLAPLLFAAHLGAILLLLRRGGSWRLAWWLAAAGQALGWGLLGGGLICICLAMPSGISIAQLVVGAIYLTVMWSMMPSIYRYRDDYELQGLTAMDVWKGG